jgi:hypothetical protein
MNNLIHQEGNGDESEGPISHPIPDNLQTSIFRQNNYTVRAVRFLIIFYLGKAPGTHPRLGATSRHSYFITLMFQEPKDSIK